MKQEMRKKLMPQQMRAAEFMPASINEEKRTADLVWSTGADVKRWDWDIGPYIERLSMDQAHIRMERLTSGSAPLLNTHAQRSLDDVIGVVERAWIEGGKGHATVRFASTPDVEAIWQKVREGVLKNISVGYRVHRAERLSLGTDEAVPTYNATDWEPMELSVVPIGADSGASIRGQDDRGSECVFINNVTDLGDEEEIAMKVQNEGAPENKPVTTLNEEQIREAAKAEAKAAERARATEIRSICRSVGMEEAFAEELCSRDVDVAEARKLVLEKLAASQKADEIRSTPRVEAGAQDEVETRRAGFENALLARALPAQFQLNEKGREYRGMSLLRMAEEVIGRRARTMSKSELATRALTTSDFAIVLANVARQTLRQGYEAQPQTFAPIVSRGTLPDYKVMERVQFGEAPDLEKVSEHGEYKAGSIGEGSEKIRLVKYGKKLLITDEVIINDDLSAFSKAPSMFGAAASRLESKLVYDVLTGSHLMSDGVELFHASHGNLMGASAINEAGLTAATIALRTQKNLSKSDTLNLMEAFLLCGPAKSVEAKKILNAQLVPTKSGDVNPFAGTMQLIVDSRISGNAWFVAGQPSQCEIIELATLEGMAGPEITTKEAHEDDQIVIKCKHVVGVKAIDYRNIVKNPGA